MSIFEMFEYIRRTNADFYTANPLEQMSETELLQLAEEAGMTLEELHEHINKSHVEMTCPLCGQPSPIWLTVKAAAVTPGVAN